MIRTLSYRPSGDGRKIFSKTKQLRLCCDRGCAHIDNIIHALESATSISTLTLCAHKSSTPHPILVALSDVPASIEEIRLVFSSLGDSQLKWDSWDLTISRALSANPRPHPKLRSLKIVLLLKLYEANHKTDIYPELVNLLSDSRDWCLVHGVAFETVRDDGEFRFPVPRISDSSFEIRPTTLLCKVPLTTSGFSMFKTTNIKFHLSSPTPLLDCATTRRVSNDGYGPIVQVNEQLNSRMQYNVPFSEYSRIIFRINLYHS